MCYLKEPSGWTINHPGDTQSGVLVAAASKAAQEPSQPMQQPAPNAGASSATGVHPLPSQILSTGERPVLLPHLPHCCSCPAPGF